MKYKKHHLQDKRDILYFYTMKQTTILDIKAFDDQANLQEFYCNRFDRHLEQNHREISIPHKHNFYLVVLFTEGAGFHEIDFNHFEVKRGSVFFLTPGQTHHWEFSESPNGYIFFHSEAFFELHFAQQRLSQFPFYYSSQNAPVIQLSENQTQLFEIQFDQILTESIQNQLYKKQKMIQLIDGVYIDLARIYLAETTRKNGVKTTYSHHIRKLETKIDQHYKTEKSPAFYANQMHISIKHLNRIVKDSVGKTTSNLISERILLEAKRLLCNASLNISEIALELGFEDSAYFSRFFRKNEGLKPTEFRSKYLIALSKHVEENG